MGEPQDKRPYFPAGFITGADSKRRGAYHSKWQHGSACRRQDCLKCLISEENLGICLTEIPIEKTASGLENHYPE